MAERRMFCKRITESDSFLDMPLSSQCLYFHLNMSADDDGFVNNPRKIQRMVGCSDDDYKLLIAKNFIITFASGIIVIKHWRMHNYIQTDRYKPTDYIDEKALLKLKENRVYTLDTECIQDGYTGKVSIEKNSLGEVRTEKKEAPYFPDDELLEDAFREFISMRKQIKKPMTEGAIKRMITKINKLERDVAVKELQRSIDHNWLDIYTDEKPKKASSLWDEWKDV